MTTDPTTLRTALEALHEATFDFISWLVASNWSPEDPDDLVPINVALSAARAVLATPAPAADEARCGFMWSVDGRACGRPEDDERHTEDAFLFHPFQPAPTPAPPTPSATEPVAALVEHYQHTVRVVLMPDGAASLWCRSCDQYLDTTPAALAEVDVEREWALWKSDNIHLTTEQFNAAMSFRNCIAAALTRR